MRRRSLLVGCGSVIGSLTGCIGRDGSTGETVTPAGSDPAGSPAPTTRTATTTTANPARPFLTDVRELIEDEVSFSRTGNTWKLEYSPSVVSGEPFRRQQTSIAKHFVDARSEGIRLEVTAYHECTTVRWAVPADLARRYDRGDVGNDTLRARLAERTRRENNC